ncbi:MAG: YvcK family protein [Candidatus Omnitrophica bacterium]|nr:YvcK family protein [Candidatus Omnitrophota bacterium]
MKFFRWFYPGIGIKRWVVLAAFGLGMMVIVGLSAVKTISQHSVLLASSATALLIFGIFLVYTALKNIVRIFVRALMPGPPEDLANIVYQSRKRDFLMRGPRVVVIGGGTGLSVLLSGIKAYTNNITAIVTVTDTGGSSGRLRDELDILPPGDIRNCLVALADAEPLIRDLFQYRFVEGEGLKGHSFGNLFITALSMVTGDFEKAIKESSKVLAIRGRVLPSTLDKVTLVGEFTDGTVAEGETKITDVRKPLKRISLRPANCRATDEALEAIQNADLIIMGPGSLYTSILPNLLLKDIANAILESDAYKIFIINAMTQPGETESYSAYDHLRVLISHTDPGIVDACFVNTQMIPKAVLDRYRETNSYPVDIDLAKIREQGYEVIGTEILKIDTQVRHDPSRLAKAIVDQYFEMLKR